MLAKLQSFGSTEERSTDLWPWQQDGSKTVVLKGCARGREGRGPHPLRSWRCRDLTGQTHFFTFPTQQVPGAQQDSQAAQGQTQVHLLPQSPPNKVTPRLTHLPQPPAPTSKTRSQMLKQHPTGVPYVSKQPGKVYDKRGTRFLPTRWDRKISRIYSVWCRSELDAPSSRVPSTWGR